MTINQEHFPTYKSLFPVLINQTTCIFNKFGTYFQKQVLCHWDP